jgi:NAD(P)-dependent dehydrogenase (short-subunit alcohol dehydrogenase family)
MTELNTWHITTEDVHISIRHAFLDQTLFFFPSMAPLTPEQQASIPRFFYNQLTYKPIPVTTPSLHGKTAIVTGSNSGIGLETCRQLLDLGLSKLILAVRNISKGHTAAAELSAGRNLPEGVIEVWELDLSDYDSILAFTERCKPLERLDFVILNAGIAPTTHTLNSKTGHETCIQTNYLSTALLCILLLPILASKRSIQGSPSRITFVSSEVSSWTSFKQRGEVPLLASFNNPEKANMLATMMVSKLLGQFFIFKLAQLVPPSTVLINSASPATVWDTGFNREMDGTWVGAIVKMVTKLYAYTSKVGARMIVDAVINHGEEVHGGFLSFQKLVW